ncbi:MAG: hypothetical protein K1X94_06455 [Sandaracinaceae bacterium]|nr:hypothetical protein [Sandaracinaceae bacterium]
MQRELAAASGALILITMQAGCGTSAPHAAASTASQSPAAPVSSVAFTLDWPAGASAAVTGTRTLTRTGGATGGGGGAVSFRLTVERDGSQTAVRSSQLSLSVRRAPIPEDSLQGVLAIGLFIPSARWTGNLEGLELTASEADGALVRDAVAGAVDATMTSLPAFAQLSAIVAGDPDVLRRQADGILGLITGLDGVELGVGEDVAFRDVATSNVGVDAPLEAMIRVGEACPCEDTSTVGATCRRLELRSTYDVRPIQAAIGTAATVQSMETTHRLVVDPDTLLPHRIEGEKRTRFLVNAGTHELALTETELCVWVFRWRPTRP